MSLKLEKPNKKQFLEYVLLAVIFVLMSVMIFGFYKTEYSYSMYETGTRHYVRGIVTEIVDQELTLSGADGEYFTGFQNLRVKILEGELKGETVTIDNYVTAQHNVVVNEGRRVVVCADTPENAEPYFTLYNYDRAYSIWILVAIFVLLVIIVGEKNGLMSCIGLGFTMCMVIGWLLPLLYNGGNATVVSIINVI